MLYRLKDAGYEAYLVGGGVRDLLLDGKPKDFDVATNAEPEQVEETFRNCRLIGRRFRLAHVRFGREVIEVATFRGEHKKTADEATHSDQGMILRDNVFGTLEEDAIRRDFTINALYYEIANFSVVDYVGGMDDLRNGIIRLMGDPETRYREDPVRMIRALRFSAKLGFRIEKKTDQPIEKLAYLLDDIPAARLYEEVLKLFHTGCALIVFDLLRDYGVLPHLFAMTNDCLNDRAVTKLIENGLSNTDARIKQGKSVTPAFLFAVLLWEPVRQETAAFEQNGEAAYPAMHKAASEVIGRQVKQVSIPRRFTSQMREIWTLQSRFENTRGKRPARLAEHPRFRAAYDFLLLRAGNGEVEQELADWWTRYQEQNGGGESASHKSHSPRRKRTSGKKHKS